MPTKELICLAYSRKMGGNCFAGLDIGTGRWIRAIGEHANGALSDFDCHMAVGNDPYVIPKPLDVIRIDFAGPEPHLAQPENWRTAKAQWQKVSSCAFAELQIVKRAVVDDPKLFRGYGRSVLSHEIEQRPPDSSLSLIRPSRLRWHTDLDSYGRKQVRGTLAVAGANYDLPLTDDRYAALLKVQDKSKWNDGLWNPTVDLLLTISLGDLYHGSHYKLIAGVVEISKASI